mgnify:FL=1
MASSSIDKAVDAVGQTVPAAVRPIAVETFNSKDYQNFVTGMVPAPFDYVSCTYTGSDLTGVVYKTGGSGGTTVATLAMTYSNGVLQTVTRS